MGKEILTFGEIKKIKFYRHKSPIFIRRCSYRESISI